MHAKEYYNQFLLLFHIMPASSDVDCGDPSTPTNGDRHPFSTVYTSEVLYFCSLGYTLQGSDRRTCQSNGEWSGHLPQCNRMLFTDLFKAGDKITSLYYVYTYKSAFKLEVQLRLSSTTMYIYKCSVFLIN